MKRTSWFPGTTIPAHEGVYEQKFDDGVFYSRWEYVWFHRCLTVQEADAECTLGNQLQPWRGLTEEVK